MYFMIEIVLVCRRVLHERANGVPNRERGASASAECVSELCRLPNAVENVSGLPRASARARGAALYGLWRAPEF